MVSQGEGSGEVLYSAFISYSRADRALARELQSKLESYVLPQALRQVGPGMRRSQRPLKPVFRDEDELVPGQDLPERIRQGLRGSKYLIVICSPSAAKSEWVEKEILDFAGLGKTADILAVVVAGQPHAAQRGHDQAQECLPRALRFQLERPESGGAVTITDVPAEPLWVDWRGEARRDRTMFLRVVAALLSLARFDELIRRDARQRRRWRIVLGSAGLAACAAVFAALSGWGSMIQGQNKHRSDQLAQLAAASAANRDYESAARFALAGFERSDWPLIGFEPLAAEDQLRNAEANSREMGVLRGHAASIVAIAYSPDGTRLATASADSTARLWDARTGAPLGKPMQSGGAVLAIAFSSDGTRLATASADDTARLWDARTGAPIGKPMRHAKAVNAVAFSPDGTRLATGSDDNTARLWDTRTGLPIGQVMQHRLAVILVAFSADGSRLATGSWLQGADLWDAHTGAPIGHMQLTIEGLRGTAVMPHAISFSPDGTRLATALDNTVCLWDARTGAPIGRPMPHKDEVLAIVFSRDGTRLATASKDTTARLWDARTGAPIGKSMQHDDKVVAVAFSPDGSSLATASADHTARLWDVHTGAPIGQPTGLGDGGQWGGAFSPDGTHLATVSDDDTVRLWDTKALDQLIIQHDEGVDEVAFSPDGTRVATTAGDATIHSAGLTTRFWDTRTGALIGQPMSYGLFRFELAVAFTPNGAFWESVSDDGALRLWDARTGAPVRQPVGLGEVRRAAFSPDGTRLATFSEDGAGRLWDVSSGAPIGQAMHHRREVSAVAFSPDGTRLATASADHTARLWDTHTGAQIGRPMQHSDTVDAVAFSPDGSRLAPASADHASIWDAHTAAPIGQPARLGGGGAVIFSPDGTRLATFSGNGAVRLWDARTGAPVGRPEGLDGDNVVFSPDGTRLATFSDNGAVRLWDARTGAPVGLPEGLDVVFSPDGTRLAAFIGDGAVQLWDARTGRRLGLPVKQFDVVNLAFSPDGTRLATASDDHTARLWWIPPALIEPVSVLRQKACLVTLANGLGRFTKAELDKSAVAHIVLSPELCPAI